MQSNVEKADYRWVTRATCEAISCDIWELLVSQGIPLLSSMRHIGNFRSNVLVHRRSIPPGGSSGLHQDAM